MQICIPITEDKGLASPVSAHFGSAPAFMIVDTETAGCRAIVNKNHEHQHGMCTPLASIAGEKIDSMVVGGIGMGALNKLAAAGIKVYHSTSRTVEETIAALKAGGLELVTIDTACNHHGQGPHGHGHGGTR
jgi:predicted Fe-Mo cluster-binding NifX family protein